MHFRTKNGFRVKMFGSKSDFENLFLKVAKRIDGKVEGVRRTVLSRELRTFVYLDLGNEGKARDP